MQSLILQVQLLLAALSAFLPLAPNRLRQSAVELIHVAGDALSVGASVAHEIDDLAAKLAAIRAEIEKMAAAGHQVSADELDAAMGRVRIASAAFRAALAEAGA